jgi:hypothetical protein
MQYDEMFCWVTKSHTKKLQETFSRCKFTFVDNVDDFIEQELDQNVCRIISLSKVKSMKIALKIKTVPDTYFLEKKGHVPYIMDIAMMDVKRPFMFSMSNLYELNR